MTRRIEMNRIQRALWAAIATGACLLTGAHAQASPKTKTKTKTFEQAVVEAQDLNSCKKKERFPIHRAHLADASGKVLPSSNPAPKLKAGQVVFLVVDEEFAGNGGIGGPLDRIPSQNELAALKGKPMCVLPD